ncbi:MAG: pseudouridylate synthase [Bacteroidales bacterium]|nr:MAG: pseudouridylate synthase [Bacteroidales bacterium]
MTDLKNIDVHELLPQCEPFVMVGHLLHFDMQRTETDMTVAPDNLFVENGVLAASGLVENIAQTCATRIGYINKYILKKGIQLGFIGAIRNLTIKELPAVGSTITTTINVIEEIMGMIMVEAVVKSGENLLAEGIMKIALSKDEAIR